MPMRLLVLACCLASLTPAFAQDQAELRRRRDAKLAKPFLQRNGWTLDLDAARERAMSDRTLIFAYFTRSYGT